MKPDEDQNTLPPGASITNWGSTPFICSGSFDVSANVPLLFSRPPTLEQQDQIEALVIDALSKAGMEHRPENGRTHVRYYYTTTATEHPGIFHHAADISWSWKKADSSKAESSCSCSTLSPSPDLSFDQACLLLRAALARITWTKRSGAGLGD